MEDARDRWERRETERRLSEKMAAAYDAYCAAHANLDLINGPASGGLGPDSVTISAKIHQAAKLQAEALAAYQAALEEFTAFVINGEAPGAAREWQG